MSHGNCFHWKRVMVSPFGSQASDHIAANRLLAQTTFRGISDSSTESLFFRPDVAQPVIKILECCIHEPSVSIFLHIKLQNTMP
jgi:hypothetical protein